MNRYHHDYVAEVVVPKWEHASGTARVHIIAHSLASATLIAIRWTRDKRRSQVLSIKRF